MANVEVVVRLSKTSLPLDIDNLIRAGVGEMAAAVEILCNLAVGPSAARVLRELGSRPALVSLTAQNLGSAKGLDIARALGCTCACGPFLGDRINALEAKQLIRRSLDRPAFAAR